MRPRSLYPGLGVLLAVALTAALLTSDPETPVPNTGPAPDAAPPGAEPAIDPRLVYPQPAPPPRRSPKPAERKQRGRSDRRAAPPIALAEMPAAAPAPPPAPPEEAAAPAGHRRRERRPAEEGPEEAEPPTPTRTLYYLYKPSGRYFFTIDPATAAYKRGLGWKLDRIALVWGEPYEGTKGLVLSDGTTAYVFIRSRQAPDGVAPLYWAGGRDGPFYSFDRAKVAEMGDAGVYGYADPF